MDGTVESILFEIARGAPFCFDLGFDNKLTSALAETEVRAKRPRNVEGFLGIERDVAERNGHSVPMHDLGSLILM